MKRKIITITFASLLIDEISKFLISKNLSSGEVVHVFKGLDFTKLYNSGCAFSLFEGKNPLLIIISLIMIYVLVKLIKEYSNSLLNALAFGLLFGGILGNLFDRIFLGHVRDFIKLTFIDFPVFNMADSFITIGVIILTINTFFERNKDGSNN